MPKRSKGIQGKISRDTPKKSLQMSIIDSDSDSKISSVRYGTHFGTLNGIKVKDDRMQEQGIQIGRFVAWI